jgi:hypothetical protein
MGALRNVTNRSGYDNQPHFTPDSRALLYTARINDQQTDIMRYELASNQTAQVTRTAESEYSPTPLPGGGFAVIRVEADSSQRLWRFNEQGLEPGVLLPALKPVGYQAWIDENRTALFVLGRPATLRLADIRTGAVDSIAANIGRAIQKIPNWPGVSFVHMVSDTIRWIRRLHGDTRVVDAIAQLPRGGEYHAWTPQGLLLATAGSRVLAWRPGSGWQVVADLADQRLQLSRIAISPSGEWIALVGERIQ